MNLSGVSDKRVNLARAVIQQTIKDLSSPDPKLSEEAEAWLHTPGFLEKCKQAGYPTALLDTLVETMTRSRAERRALCSKALKVLRDEWDNNN